MEVDVGRPEELMINRYLKLRMATGNIVSALGFLALLWSTVVLLGGFVGDLLVKEFWVVTALSFLMSFRFAQVFNREIGKGHYIEEIRIIPILQKQKWVEAHKVIIVLRVVRVMKLIFAYCFILAFVASPFVNLGVSVWRLAQQDYGDAGGDTPNTAKLNAALNIFYALILFQSLFAFYYLVHFCLEDGLNSWTEKHCGLEEWPFTVVGMYSSQTERKFYKDGDLPDKWDLITYGIELLQSASGDDHLWAARVLDQLFDKDQSVRQELLSSQISIQNLIGMIAPTRRGTDDYNIEKRERAARIVAHLATGLHITHFPGILVQCICSLLESCKQFSEPQVTSLSENYPNNEQRLPDPDKKDPRRSLETSDRQDDAHMVVPIQDQTDHEQEQVVTKSFARSTNGKRTTLHEWTKKLDEKINKKLEEWNKKLDEKLDECKKARKERTKEDESRRFTYGSRGATELISQGLLILERLTQDEENCTEISKHQRLLSKITSPLSSHDFLSNVRDENGTMVEMLTKSLTVVSRLLTSPGDGATRLRLELVSNKDAVSNLISILETDGKGAQKLHEQALEILTELAFDDSFKKLDFNKLFKALLGIFLEKEDNNTTVQEPKNATIQEPKNATSQVEQADRESATRLRGKAGEALARLLPVSAARGRLSEQDTINLWTMLLDHILSSEMGTAQGNNENQSKETKFVAAMLSLTVVMCDENESSKEYFAHHMPKDTDMVKKLKEILEANKRRSAECWTIVKHICQVVIAIIKVKPSCIKHFNEHNFKKALTEVSNTMSEVDDCMLFAGNDREVIKPARSLASLVKEAQELLKTAQE